LKLRAGAISFNHVSLTGLIHSGEKQSFWFSGLGGSRTGPVSIRRFMRPKALLINPGVDSPLQFARCRNAVRSTADAFF
jgi:succinate-semialdehyde dehydrogenase / glutarate-semialdehyde dehydrogenase